MGSEGREAAPEVWGVLREGDGGRGTGVLIRAGEGCLGRGSKIGVGGRSHVVVQKKGDPVRGIVQEQQPLQEAGQKRSRLFHKHGQKHPGGRLEDAPHMGSEGSPDFSVAPTHPPP